MRAVVVVVAVLTAAMVGCFAAAVWLKQDEHSDAWKCADGVESTCGSLPDVIPPPREPVHAARNAPVPNTTGEDTDTATIFVSVASYRDRLCTATVRQAFERAAHPGRVFVGVYQQNGPTDAACQPDDAWADHVRVMAVGEEEAHGPAYARYKCSRMYGGEDYYMQIDSHTAFVNGWDTKALLQLQRARTRWSQLAESHDTAMRGRDEYMARVLITQYPPQSSGDDHDDVQERRVPHNCRAAWAKDKPWMIAHSALRPPMSAPAATLFIAAGFLFAPAALLREVPFDPRLKDMFHGEETILSLRAFCAGWSAFTPTENIVAHWYVRSGEPRVWDTPRWSALASSSRTPNAAETVLWGTLSGRSVDADARLALWYRRDPNSFWRALGERPACSAAAICSRIPQISTCDPAGQRRVDAAIMSISAFAASG